MKPAKPPGAQPLQQGPQTPGPVRLPLAIPIEPYMRDHRYNGRIIVPAVEILQRLAASVQSQYPGTPVSGMRSASFDRFLQADDDTNVINARHELQQLEGGALLSRLTTNAAVAGGNVRRTKVHAAVEFSTAGEKGGRVPVDVAAALEGIAFEVPAERVYAELVPFGPAYRNIAGSVFLSENGAAGIVRGPEIPAPSVPLGSPFPLDAAMHAACAWGQRYRGYVAFPVGFEERNIFRPTMPGQDFYCRVLPGSDCGRNSFLADILIFNLEGALCESLLNVIMKDVTGGKASPPAWVRAGAIDDKLINIRGNCLGLSVVDTRTVAAFASRALSPIERERYDGMGEKRQKTFLGGRLALKILTRKLSEDYETPAQEIQTIKPDGALPCCPVPGISCSLSHDSRYAFAAADRGSVGVDIERISERVMKARHLYMSKEEMDLAEKFPPGSLPASLRVWSVKECLSKAVGMHLAECWKPANVYDIGESRSLLKFKGTEYIAFHDLVEDHLFTLVKRRNAR